MCLLAFASMTVLVVMASSETTPPKEHYDLANARPLFEKFKVDYNRQYKDKADEEEHFQAFYESLKKINELNDSSSTATFGINNFADYTEKERKRLNGLVTRRPIIGH